MGGKVAAETGANFVQCDVANYQDQLALFKEAHRKFGSLDHEVSNAAVYEPVGFFDSYLDLQSVEKVRDNIHLRDLE